MKLLHVISSADRERGGPIEGIIQITAALNNYRRDCETEIVTCDDPSASFLGRVPLKINAVGPALTAYNYTPRLIPWLRRNVRRFDVVIVNGLWQYCDFASWVSLHESSVPYLVYTHGMLDPWFKRTYPLKHLKKCLFWPWSGYRLLRDARAVVFTAEDERLAARESFSMYNCNEIVLPFGTAAPQGDPNRERRLFLSRFPELEGKRIVLFLGRIHPKKGCDLLIQAFAATMAKDANFHLVMAGPDTTGLRSELERLSKRFSVTDRITWTGMLSGEIKWGALYAAELFALTSHQENFGIAVAEALSCGLPVAITRRINIWREIEQDRAGLTADDTVEGAKALLSSWAALAPDERKAMGNRARECFRHRFDINQGIKDVYNLFSEATSAGTGVASSTDSSDKPL